MAFEQQNVEQKMIGKDATKVCVPKKLRQAKSNAYTPQSSSDIVRHFWVLKQISM